MLSKVFKKIADLKVLYLFFITFFVGACLIPYSVSGDFSESYLAEDDLLPGMIVSLSGESPNNVLAANSNNSSNMFGVVVEEDDSSIHFSNIDNEDVVAVATSGDVYVFVSDINGEIRPGDAITATTLNGVGGKAVEDGRAIGIAKEFFGENNQDENTRNVEVETSTGRVDVSVGKIRASLNVYDYIAPREEQDMLSRLREVAETIVQKPVSIVRVLIASIISLITLVVVVIMLGSSVQGSMVALGRNPLAKKTIISSMVRVILLSVFVLALGIATAYLALIS